MEKKYIQAECFMEDSRKNVIDTIIAEERGKSMDSK